MALPSGTRLGPYILESSLGAGGMGEVYKARDTRLERTVAVKVLNSALVATPDLKLRFEREAKLISQLQHPHICVLHDIGSENGTAFLVMEYLEGESLAERLTRGALPLEQVIRIGSEIADALQRAHRAGIVHRDLKPGNIMLTRSGAKLMDFGLAKPAGMAAGASPAGETATIFSAPTMSQSPTPLTAAGTIVGTVQYMAPEQIQGHEADPRSDIFSFGLVLYEMVTGRRAFEAKNQASVAAAILATEPQPVSALRPDAPPALAKLIESCLAKEEDERIQSPHDVKLQLRWVQPAQAISGARRVPRLRWMAATLAAIAVVAAIPAWYFARQARRPAAVYRSSLLPPENTTFVTEITNAGVPVLSPDGSKLAFVAADDQGNVALYVRAMNSTLAQLLAGTQNAVYPFWSPDSRSIAYFADGKLRRIEAGGGPSEILAEAPNPRGGSWGPGNVIVFAGTQAGPLKQVAASGGSVSQASTLGTEEMAHQWPWFLPDGKHFLYHTLPASELKVGELGSKEQRLLVKDAGAAAYASGYLLFVRDENNLFAQAFDPDKLAVTGSAAPIAQHVVTNFTVGRRGIFSVSNNGLLVYQAQASALGWPLTWYDEDGKQLGVLAGDGHFYGPNISPDGSRVAVSEGSSSLRADIWEFDLHRGTRMRLTFDGVNSAPMWTADGKNLLYTSFRNGHESVYSKPADNSGPERLVADNQARLLRWKSVSADGHYLAYMCVTQADWDIWGVDLWGGGKPFPVLQDPFTKVEPVLSPDGRWMAYSSNESGRFELYLTAFPSSGPKWQVSTQGGSRPHWRGDGKVLYFAVNNERMMAVDVSDKGGILSLGTPRLLFRAHMQAGPFGSYDVTRDGKKFLLNLVNAPGGGAPLTLVNNWTAELNK